MPETKPVTYEQRLSEVEKLLTDVTGNKTLEGRSDHALRDAEKPYTLATTRPRLPTRHASEAAYRLAHLRLRKPHLLRQIFGGDLEAFPQDANLQADVEQR